jgi:hypothetical protein
MRDIYLEYVNGRGNPPDIFIGCPVTSIGTGLVYMSRPYDFYFLLSD